MLGTVSGLASEPYLRGRGETKLDLPRVVCECVDVFQMSYLDYLRIGMYTSVLSYTLVYSPMSMTPHRMTLVELQGTQSLATGAVGQGVY